MAVWLDDEFPEHPKIEALCDDRAAWLYVAGLCYANRNLTGGRIHKTAALRLTNTVTTAVIRKLLSSPVPGKGPLWEVEGDHYVIHDYLAHQQAAERRRAEREEERRKRSEHARNAVNARWASREHPGEKKLSSNRVDVEKPVSSDRVAPRVDRENDSSSPPGILLSSDRVPAEHDPEKPLTSRAHAQTGALRASDQSPKPKPSTHLGVNHLGVAPESAETRRVNGESQNPPPPPDPLIERALEAYDHGRRRDARRGEMIRVINALRLHIDEMLIDEAVGSMLTRKPAPGPRWLLTTCIDWAQQRGAELSHRQIDEILAAVGAPAGAAL